MIPTPMLSPYGTLTGQLFQYSANLAAFESWALHDHGGPPAPPPLNKLILVGGLSDGLLPTPYTADLDKICQELGHWSLVQPILSSSYTGFGHGTLQRDCDELQTLCQYLVRHRQAEKLALVSHSTGCQDLVYFCQHADQAFIDRYVRLMVLQAPVSDREGAQMEPKFADHLQTAQNMRATDQLDEMMPRNAFWAPLTARRFLDLHEKGNTDDYFSSDYTDHELRERLQHMGTHEHLHTLVAFSGADEFVPSHVDRPQLAARLVHAMRGGHTDTAQRVHALYLKTGNHNLAQQDDDKRTFVQKIKELLQLLDSL